MSHAPAITACRPIAGLAVLCTRRQLAYLTNYTLQSAFINRADVVNDGHRLKSNKLNARILMRQLYEFIPQFYIQCHVHFTIYTRTSQLRDHHSHSIQVQATGTEIFTPITALRDLSPVTVSRLS